MEGCSIRCRGNTPLNTHLRRSHKISLPLTRRHLVAAAAVATSRPAAGRGIGLMSGPSIANIDIDADEVDALDAMLSLRQ